MINNEPSTLKSWAAGKLAMFAIGLACGLTIYKLGLIQKLSGKLFNSKKEQE